MRRSLLPFDTVLYFSSEVKTVMYRVLQSVGIINGAHQSDICAVQLSVNEQTAESKHFHFLINWWFLVKLKIRLRHCEKNGIHLVYLSIFSVVSLEDSRTVEPVRDKQVNYLPRFWETYPWMYCFCLWWCAFCNNVILHCGSCQLQFYFTPVLLIFAPVLCLYSTFCLSFLLVRFP